MDGKKGSFPKTLTSRLIMLSPEVLGAFSFPEPALPFSRGTERGKGNAKRVPLEKGNEGSGEENVLGTDH